MLVQRFWLQTPKFQHFHLVQHSVRRISHLQRNAWYLFPRLYQLLTLPQFLCPPPKAGLTFTTMLSSNI